MMQTGAKFSGVKSVLVVLSSRATAFDQSGLRNLISHAYPGAAVFFLSTSGQPMGLSAPDRVDLVVDLTEPGARQSLFFAVKMRSRGRFVVGRRAGFFFRAAKYDRIYEDATDRQAPSDYIDKEVWAQRRVLELAGIPAVKQGGVTPDRSKDIAATLPPLQNR